MNRYVASMEKIENVYFILAEIPLRRTSNELMYDIKIDFRNRNWSQFTHGIAGWRAIVNLVM
jgi:hypothetical protein